MNFFWKLRKPLIVMLLKIGGFLIVCIPTFEASKIHFFFF